MSIFNQVTDTASAARVSKQAQAPDKHVTIYDNFAKSFHILQLQSLSSDSCKMWEGKANVSKTTLCVSDHHTVCLKGKFMTSASPLMDGEKAVCLLCSYWNILLQEKPLLSDFWK